MFYNTFLIDILSLLLCIYVCNIIKQNLEGERGDFVDPVPFQSAVLHELDGNAKFWVGKDYVNFIIKDLVNLDAPYAGEYRNHYMFCLF